MQQMVDGLVGRLSPDSLVTNALVQGIRRDSEQTWAVTADYETASFDGVVVAGTSAVALESSPSA